MQRRHQATFVVRRFELGPLFRLGFLIGGAVGLFPSFIATLAILRVVSALRQLMENASHVTTAIPLINQLISFDFVALLGLTGNLKSLAFVDDHAWLFGLALFVFLALFCAICSSIAAMAGAMVYNSLSRRIGGLRVVLEETTLER